MSNKLKKLYIIILPLFIVSFILPGTGFDKLQHTETSPPTTRPVLKSILVSPSSFQRYFDNKLKIVFQYKDPGGDLKGGSLELLVVNDRKEKQTISIPLNRSRYRKATGKGRAKTVIEIFDSSHITLQARLIDANGSKSRWRKIKLDSKDLVDDAILGKIQEFESNVGPAGADTGNRISDRMAYYHVPAVSIALINNSHIEWSRAYGKTINGGDEDATISTLFQAASLSKTIAAGASMILVNGEDVELNQNINNYLTSWHLPDNNNTVDQKVTLERLLSHTAGLQAFGLPGYSQTASIPTLLQMLDGLPPAVNPAVRVLTVPGTAFNYSNLGYLVVQQMVPDVTGSDYGTFVKDNIFKPLKIIRSNFNHLIQASGSVEIARGHYTDGRTLTGGWNRFPEHCAAGLWTTPTEYALFLIEILDTWNGKDGKVFSAGDLDEMLRPRLNGYGLGILIGDVNGLEYLSHSGSTNGYRCTYALFPDLDMGAVIMTNGDLGASLADEITESLANVYLNEYGFINSEK